MTKRSLVEIRPVAVLATMLAARKKSKTALRITRHIPHFQTIFGF